MNQFHLIRQRLRSEIWFIPPSVILGIGVGLFSSGYWLTDLLPASSRQMLAFTGLAAVVGAAGYWYLLPWMRTRLLAMTASQRILVIVLGVLSGLAMFLGGTSQWTFPSRYVPFLLPSHSLQISVEPGAPSGERLAIMWFKTALGDVSYDAIHLSGWRREGDQLVLANTDQNALRWSGKTGQNAELVFQGSAPGRTLVISWDSREEIIHPVGGKFAYTHEFDIPWYASGTLVLSVGILLFVSMALALILLLWEKRGVLTPGMVDSLSRTPGKTDRYDAMLIVGAIILALLLRLPNLGRLFPAVDEYYHLIAARQITEGAALSSVYQRGLWLVTLPVSLALRIFGYQLWAARLAGVLFNVLAILPLYLLARKINRTVAVLATVLYAASPWVVTFARIAREYSFYPFYFFWIVLGMIAFLEGIPPGLVLARDWRALLKPKMLLIGASLVLPPMYAFYGDRLSTFRTIWIAYLVFGAFLLSRFNWKARLNLPILAVLIAGILLVARGWYEDQKAKVSTLPSFNPVPVQYFLPNPQQQWYFGRLVPLIVVGVLGMAACCYLIRRRNITPLFILALFSTSLAVFALFAKTFFHTRHLTFTELWYVMVVAVGAYVVWKGLTLIIAPKSQFLNLILAVALGLSMLNFEQIIVPITSTNPDNPISEDYLHDLSSVHAFMLSHVQPHDVLVSTVYGLYSSWMEEPAFEANYRITSQTPRDEILALINQHESGWIVIDEIRLALSTLGPREFAGIGDVEYIGLFGDEHVWHWQHPAGGSGAP